MWDFSNFPSGKIVEKYGIVALLKYFIFYELFYHSISGSKGELGVKCHHALKKNKICQKLFMVVIRGERQIILET